MDPMEVALMRMLLKPGGSMVEYGSGYSTRFFARDVPKYAVIEENQKWADIVVKQLADDGLAHVDMHVAPTKVADGGSGPSPYVTEFGSCCKTFKAREANLVLVDGDVRDDVLRFIQPILSPHTIVVLHDTCRESEANLNMWTKGYDVVLRTSMSSQPGGGCMYVLRVAPSPAGVQQTAVMPGDLKSAGKVRRPPGAASWQEVLGLPTPPR